MGVVPAQTGGNQRKDAELVGMNRNTRRRRRADLGTEKKKVGKQKKSRDARALDEA